MEPLPGVLNSGEVDLSPILLLLACSSPPAIRLQNHGGRVVERVGGVVDWLDLHEIGIQILLCCEPSREDQLQRHAAEIQGYFCAGGDLCGASDLNQLNKPNPPLPILHPAPSKSKRFFLIIKNIYIL